MWYSTWKPEQTIANQNLENVEKQYLSIFQELKRDLEAILILFET